MFEITGCISKVRLGDEITLRWVGYRRPWGKNDWPFNVVVVGHQNGWPVVATNEDNCLSGTTTTFLKFLEKNPQTKLYRYYGCCGPHFEYLKIKKTSK